jgi:subtilisin family serine protease
MARSGWKALLAPIALLCATTAFAQDDGRYMVKFRDFNGAANVIAAAGGRIVHELEPQGVIAAYLPEQALKGLRNNPNVEYVEVDPRRYPMAEVKPYGITMVQADDPAFPSSGQSGVMVCIIDSGYQRAHEDLQDTYVTGTNDSGTGNWYEDSCGHGTHVAGTIAALKGNSVGVIGVAGGGSINLHIEKTFNGSDCRWTYSSNLVTALNRCKSAASGKKLVVNMSLGGSTSSTTENNAFQTAYNEGVLSVAAAGNDGSTRKSYPASYSSVISVAAVDSNKTVASFSQKNDAVELAAPGVGVLSTTPFKPASLSANGSTWIGANLDGSTRSDVTGTLVDGGRCTAAGSWSGRVVLCERGDISFADKVNNVRLGGGAGAVIYNNVSGGFAGTLNGTSTIPAISISREDGLAARALGSVPADLVNSAGFGNGYESYDGTSMATPHVAGVAALVWGVDTNKTNAQIRDALQKSAQDLGAAGKDNSYGFGLVQAAAAVAYLSGSGGGGGGTTPTITLTVTKSKVKGANFANLSWSGAGGSVDVFRGSTKLATVSGTTYSNGPLSKGSYTYKVCNAGTTTCSNTVTVSF